MTELRANRVLAPYLHEDSADLKWEPGRNLEYLSYSRSVFEGRQACLDGWFTADQLEAVAWWIRHRRREPARSPARFTSR